MTRTTGKHVGAVGSKDSDIMIIGEAPGKNEARQGEPFVGRSGRLLNSLLTKSGIHRKSCYITNVIKEKPYKNNIDPFVRTSGNPTVTEKGKPYVKELKREIKRVDSNVVVAVGNTPLFVLTRETGITKYRGSILESTLVDGQKVIPIIHPAAALRMYIYRHYISKDLHRVKEESEFPEVDLPEYNYIISPSFYETMEYLEACHRQTKGFVAYDIEVSNEEVNCISFSKEPHEAISIPFLGDGKQYFDPDQELKVWLKIAEILEDEEVTKVAQNAVFDGSFLLRKYGIHLRNIEDTMIAAKVLYPDFPKGLDFLTSIYTKIPYYKDDGKYRNPQVSDRNYWIYNAKDSAVLLEVLPQQLEELDNLGNLETYLEQRKLVLPLIYMNEKGVKMDTDILDRKAEKAADRMREIRRGIVTHAGHDINPNSYKQLQNYFYDELDLDPYTNKGKPTTDETAMKRLSRRGYKVADLVLEYRGLSKAKGTYYEVTLDEDKRLRCSFNPVGTRFGRLSSSKTIFDTGTNMQNLTPEFKEAMLPDENHIGYEIDAGQAENRVVAFVGPDRKMIKAFKNGEDIHKLTASEIFGKPVENISDKDDIKKDPSRAASIGSGDKSERFWGKTANHAFNYKQGYKSFALKYEIPENDGKRIRKSYFRSYPGVKKYHRFIENQLKKSRKLSNLFDRKYIFMGRWGQGLIREACDFIPQSTVADIINRWGLNEIYYNQEKYKPVKLLSQIHDSVVFEISMENSFMKHAKMVKDICESMEQKLRYRGRKFSIPAEVTVYGTNFRDGVEIGEVTDKSLVEIANEIEEAFYKSKEKAQA